MVSVTQVKKALRTLLLDELPTVLARADREADDGITTPPPYEIVTTERGRFGSFGGYPALELIGVVSEPTIDSGENSGAQIYEHRVAVRVTAVNDDEERVTVWCERYLWAIRQLAYDPMVPIGPMRSGTEGYGQLEMRNAEEPFVKGAYIELFIITVGE